MGLLALSLSGCSGVFFQPDRVDYRYAESTGLLKEDVYFTSEDGTRLHGWFLPASGAPSGTIFYLHGNAQNISAHVASVGWLPREGFNVFLFDYRGYGRSSGKESLVGALADIRSAYRTLIQRTDVDSNRIILLGQSLGGTLGLYTASHAPSEFNVRAVVAESAFADYHMIAQEKLAGSWVTWPFQWLAWLLINNTYSPLESIGSIAPVPLLFIHGALDRIVPLHHSVLLHARAKAPKDIWILKKGRHINAYSNLEFRERLVFWLREHFKK